MMPLVVVMGTAQVPKRLVRLTPLGVGVCVGSLHDKDDVYVDLFRWVVIGEAEKGLSLVDQGCRR
jgi:hypothetical protein